MSYKRQVKVFLVILPSFTFLCFLTYVGTCRFYYAYRKNSPVYSLSSDPSQKIFVPPIFRFSHVMITLALKIFHGPTCHPVSLKHIRMSLPFSPLIFKPFHKACPSFRTKLRIFNAIPKVPWKTPISQRPIQLPFSTQVPIPYISFPIKSLIVTFHV